MNHAATRSQSAVTVAENHNGSSGGLSFGGSPARLRDVSSHRPMSYSYAYVPGHGRSQRDNSQLPNTEHPGCVWATAHGDVSPQAER